MGSLKNQLGNYGENLASEYIQKIGYKILDIRFRCKTGEIDIVAKDKNYIVFIEVKARYSNYFGFPRESVNFTKRTRLIRTAQYYIHSKNLYNNSFRFDVVEVFFNSNDNSSSLELIKDAFQI